MPLGYELTRPAPCHPQAALGPLACFDGGCSGLANELVFGVSLATVACLTGLVKSAELGVSEEECDKLKDALENSERYVCVGWGFKGMCGVGGEMAPAIFQGLKCSMVVIYAVVCNRYNA